MRRRKASGPKIGPELQGLRLTLAPLAELDAGFYKTVCRTMREPGLVPKPLPPRSWPLGNAPLPCEACGAGPLAPPPATAIGGVPKATGVEGSEPMYCE